MEKTAENSTKVRMITIDEDHAGQRIDNFLLTLLKGLPKSRIYRILRKGEVRVNKGRINAQYRLELGDTVRVPPVKLDDTPGKPLVPVGHLNGIVESRTLFEDDYIWVLNKPSGIPVHGGSGQQYGLIEGMREARPDLKYLELVHRLDRDTSGVLVMAKRRSALTHLHQQFREDAVKKSYKALFDGEWQQKRFWVEAPLKKNQMQGGERFVKVSPEGKAASTYFQRIEKFKLATLVEARPATGRTHQIRVHAAHLGFPLAGDIRYGKNESHPIFKKLGLKRLFLHAAKLQFQHPASDQMVTIDAPLDDDLLLVLQNLRNDG